MHLHRWTPGWVNWEDCWCPTSVNIGYPVNIKVRQKINNLIMTNIRNFSVLRHFYCSSRGDMSLQICKHQRDKFCQTTIWMHFWHQYLPRSTSLLDRVCIMEMAYLFVTQEGESCSRIVIAFRWWCNTKIVLTCILWVFRLSNMQHSHAECDSCFSVQLFSFP